MTIKCDLVKKKPMSCTNFKSYIEKYVISVVTYFLGDLGDSLNPYKYQK